MIIEYILLLVNVVLDVLHTRVVNQFSDTSLIMNLPMTSSTEQAILSLYSDLLVRSELMITVNRTETMGSMPSQSGYGRRRIVTTPPRPWRHSRSRGYARTTATNPTYVLGYAYYIRSCQLCQVCFNHVIFQSINSFRSFTFQ